MQGVRSPRDRQGERTGHHIEGQFPARPWIRGARPPRCARRPAGRSVRAMNITTYLGDKPVMRIRFGDPGMRTAAPPMVISQAAVEAALRDRLTELGGEIEWGTPLVDLRQDNASGASVAVGAADEVQVGWVVGCDGAASTTRHLAGIDFPGVKLSERFLLADVRLDWDLDRSGTTGWIHPDGHDRRYADATPTDCGELSPMTRASPRISRPSRKSSPGLNRIIPERTGRDVRVDDAAWLSMFSVHRRLAETYRRGRVLLAGDAAHTHAPFGGQGMLTGLGDAENLAWKLALVVSGRAEARLLDTYQRERRPLATEVLRGTSAVTKINMARGPVGRFLRDRLVVPCSICPACSAGSRTRRRSCGSATGTGRWPHGRCPSAIHVPGTACPGCAAPTCAGGGGCCRAMKLCSRLRSRTSATVSRYSARDQNQMLSWCGLTAISPGGGVSRTPSTTGYSVRSRQGMCGDGREPRASTRPRHRRRGHECSAGSIHRIRHRRYEHRAGGQARRCREAHRLSTLGGQGAIGRRRDRSARRHRSALADARRDRRHPTARTRPAQRRGGRKHGGRPEVSCARRADLWLGRSHIRY